MSDYPDSGDAPAPRTLATLAATSSYEPTPARLAKLEFQMRQVMQDADSMSGKIVALTASIADLERQLAETRTTVNILLKQRLDELDSKLEHLGLSASEIERMTQQQEEDSA